MTFKRNVHKRVNKMKNEVSININNKQKSIKRLVKAVRNLELFKNSCRI